MSLLHFLQDRRNPRNGIQRVYCVMLELYSDAEPRGFAAEYVGRKSGVKRRDVLKHWTTLVARGWLVEHPRGGGDRKRFFTLPATAQRDAA